MGRAARTDEIRVLRARVEELEREQQVLREALTRARADATLLRRASASGPLGTFVCLPDGRIAEADPHFLTMVGRTREDLLAGRLRWTDLTPSEWLARDEEAVREIRARGACTPYEKEYLRPDGSRVPVLVGGAALGGDAPRGAAFVLDLTGSRAAEAEQRRRGDQLALALEGAGFGTWAWDLATNRVELSETNEALFGIGPGAFPGSWEATEALIHPEDREGLAEAIRRALEDPERADRYQAEFRVTTPGAEGRWFASFGRILRDAAGEARRVVGVTLDVTERKRMELSLAESEAHLRRVQRIAQLGSYDVELRGTSDRWSEEVYAIFGIPPGERISVGRIVEEMVLAEDREGLRDELRRTLQRSTAFEVEFRLTRPDGALRWLRSVGETMVEPGRPPRIVGSLIDVTERRQLEQRLLQAQKLEAVGRLAGGVAHDFNNLLTVVNGCCELLAGHFEPASDPAGTLREIRAAVEQGARLTHQLLAFGRRSVLVPVELDLNTLLRELEGLLRRLIPADVDLEVRLDPSLGRVRADPSQLEQVVMNLVLNARDAMPEGGRLTIETRRTRVDEGEAPPGGGLPRGVWATLLVSDTGAGMDEETLAQVFEPFFTTKGRGKGTGLGLATVFGVVRQSGGHVEVSSRAGRGSTFRIHLPELAPAPLDRTLPERSPEARASAGLSGHETVLLCEDAEPLRRLLAAALRARGYVVLEAGNGADALEVAEGHRGGIDLLVTDVVMPRMSGPELAARLAADRPGLRVLFVSGYTGDAIDGRELDGRERRLLAKPFTTMELARAVRETLRG